MKNAGNVAGRMIVCLRGDWVKASAVISVESLN